MNVINTVRGKINKWKEAKTMEKIIKDLPIRIESNWCEFTLCCHCMLLFTCSKNEECQKSNVISPERYEDKDVEREIW